MCPAVDWTEKRSKDGGDAEYFAVIGLGFS